MAHIALQAIAAVRIQAKARLLPASAPAGVAGTAWIAAPVAAAVREEWYDEFCHRIARVRAAGKEMEFDRRGPYPLCAMFGPPVPVVEIVLKFFLWCGEMRVGPGLPAHRSAHTAHLVDPAD